MIQYRRRVLRSRAGNHEDCRRDCGGPEMYVRHDPNLVS